MEIELPSSGCNVYYGNYVDNYKNSVRTRYYFSGNRLVASTTSSYTRIPDGAICLTQGDLVYNPESEVYFNVISFIIATLFIVVAIRLVIFPFFRRIK